jgi:hypothetical protein
MSTATEILKEMSSDYKDSAVNKFGYNNDVDTTASEDIWSVGGLYPYATFTTAKSLEILSSSAEDGAGTLTGTSEITINGLDDNLNNQTEIIEPNGTGVVAVPGTWKAVNRAFINDGATGSAKTNVGTITIRVASGGATVSEIPAARGQTQQAVYRVPNGSATLRVTKIEAYTDASTGKTASMQLISVGSDCVTTRVKSSAPISENIKWDRSYSKGGIEIKSGEWVAIRALSVAQNDTAITADFDGVLE